MTATQVDQKGVIRRCQQCGQLNRLPFAKLGNPARCGRCKTELPALSEPVDVSEESSFEELVSGSSLPVLVDFWAQWCGPCKMMAPELTRFAGRNAGRVAVAKANTEALPSLAHRFSISAIPTLVLFAGGREIGRIQGARSATELESFISQVLRVDSSAPR